MNINISLWKNSPLCLACAKVYAKYIIFTNQEARSSRKIFLYNRILLKCKRNKVCETQCTQHIRTNSLYLASRSSDVIDLGSARVLVAGRKRGEPDFSRGCYPVKKAWVESRRGEPFRSNPGGLGGESRDEFMGFATRHRPGSPSPSSSSSSSSFRSSLRPRSMTGGRGVRKINDIFRGARATIRAAWVPKDDPTSPIDRPRTNERGNATFSRRMLACCEYVNIFYSTLSLGRGIKLFPPRGCRGRFNLLVATKSGNPFRSVQRIQSCRLGLLFREREIFFIISIISDFSTK